MLDRSIKAFLAYLSEDRGYSPLTVTGYQRELERFMASLGRRPKSVDQVSRAQVLSFLRQPVSGGSPQHPRGRAPAPRTRNRRLAVLRSFWAYLAREGLVQGPGLVLTIEWAKEPESEAEVLSSADFRAFRAAVRRQESPFLRGRDLAIAYTLYFAGLRLSELCGLDVSDIDFERERLRRVKRKGGDEVSLPACETLLGALASWLELRGRLCLEAEPALFVSERRRRLGHRAVEQLVSRYAIKAGLDQRVTPHTFRHSHATALLDAGASIRSVQAQLGHRSIRTTAKYTRPNDNQVREGLKALERGVG